MPRRRDPVPRARAAGHWLGGILLLGILGGGVVVAAMLLWENLDVRQLAPTLAQAPGPLPDPETPVAPGVQPGSFPVVLFNSSRNREYFPDESYYPGVLSRWRRLLTEMGGEIRDASTSEELATLDPGELLALPVAPCLSRAEVEFILDHVAAGGGVVANWAVGARDEACEWRGWETVAELTGAGDVRELPVREALYLTVPAGLPLSPGLDPGTRIELRPEPSLALFQPGPRVFWSDWALNPAPDESGGGADVAATAFRAASGGRVAWFGFQLSQAATERDSLRVERLAQNGMAWAAGLAIASPAAWPDAARAALLLVQDVEAEYENSEAMAELLQAEELPGTFFVVSQLVMDDSDLSRRLTGAGEVGSQTSDHMPVAGLTYQDQLVRLRRSWTEIRGWTGSAPLGLRPPEESFDHNTLRAWSEVGGTYVLGVNQARSGSPEVHRAGAQRIILIPRLLKDDYNVFVQEGAMRADRLTEAFLEGAEKLRSLGGVAVVAVHTQIVDTDRRLEAVRAVADSARARGDWWITQAGELASWWNARASVQVSIDPPATPEAEADTASGGGTPVLSDLESEGDSLAPPPVVGWDLEVRSSGDAGISSLWIDVFLPNPASSELQPFIGGYPVTFARTEWGLRVSVGELGPGEIRSISLRRPEG